MLVTNNNEKGDICEPDTEIGNCTYKNIRH